jgi:hypothetical protein
MTASRGLRRVPPTLVAWVRQGVDRVGLTGVADDLHCTRTTVMRICGDIPVTEGTIALVTMGRQRIGEWP